MRDSALRVKRSIFSSSSKIKVIVRKRAIQSSMNISNPYQTEIPQHRLIPTKADLLQKTLKYQMDLPKNSVASSINDICIPEIAQVDPNYGNIPVLKARESVK